MIESKIPTIEQCTIPEMVSDTAQQQYTYKEVANLKRVSVQTVMEWVKRGKVPSPVYTGFTARFTADQVAEILCGTSADGTFPVTPSPRAAIGKMGGSSKKPKKGKAKNPAQRAKLPVKLVANTKAARRIAAKKPTAKKPTAKKAKVRK